MRPTALLCTTNAKVDDINERIIGTDVLGTAFQNRESRDYFAVNSMQELEMRDRFPHEMLDAHEQSGLPPNKLILKVGCPIVMLRNYGVREGVVNGTKLVITELHDNCVKAGSRYLKADGTISCCCSIHVRSKLNVAIVVYF